MVAKEFDMYVHHRGERSVWSNEGLAMYDVIILDTAEYQTESSNQIGPLFVLCSLDAVRKSNVIKTCPPGMT